MPRCDGVLVDGSGVFRTKAWWGRVDDAVIKCDREAPDLCVIAVDRTKGGLTLLETAPGVTAEDVIEKTGAPIARQAAAA